MWDLSKVIYTCPRGCGCQIWVRIVIRKVICVATICKYKNVQTFGLFSCALKILKIFITSNFFVRDHMSGKLDFTSFLFLHTCTWAWHYLSVCHY